jgi:hypothetical protein
MALIFGDGWDNYGTVLDFWDFDGTDDLINTTVGNPRTGRGCLQIRSAAFGPMKMFDPFTHLLFCTAWNSSAAGDVFHFMNGVNNINVRVVVLGDGSVQFSWGNIPTIIGTTAVGLVVFNSYAHIACEVQNFTANTGIITLWINGVQVFHQTGLHTHTDLNPVGFFSSNGVRLMGPGGIPTHCFHDDFFVLDCSTSPNVTFLGALRLYAIAPTANAAVTWTPLAGTNFSEVNEVPPDGDTSYNSSPNIGDVDQYVYPLTGVPANSTLFFVQHELDMKVDSGSRSVASDVNGVVAAATALTSGYHIYPTPYDVNPSTGVQFVPGDFPVQAGPKVTA